MSADLFAAFGDAEPDITVAPAKASSGPAIGRQPANSSMTTQFCGLALNTTHSHAEPSLDDDFDDFGEFENAEQNAEVQNGTEPRPCASQRTDTHRATGNEQKLDQAQSLPAQTAFKVPNDSQNIVRDPDVLFDAEDPEETVWQDAALDEGGIDDHDDDFGDFEDGPFDQTTPNPIRQPKIVEPERESMDLLDLDPQSSIPAAQSQSPASKPTTHAARQNKRPVRSPQPKARPVAKQPSPHNEDAWDDFEAIQPTKGPSPTNSDFDLPPTPTLAVPRSLVQSLLTLPKPPTSPPTTPQTTIPPPSLLLSALTPTLQTLSTTFLTPLLLLPAPQKSALLSAPQTRAFVTAYLALANVLAHLLAGRKQRWKRDKFLSQSMAIGPAISGRGGGMKIAGVDRGEVHREEQVVGEAVRVWKASVGKLRGVVAGVNAADDGNDGKRALVVPEIAEVLPVRTARPAEGAVVGLLACCVCGLKREERVGRVDGEVLDSFGEWWIEGANVHTKCWNWWKMVEQELKGR